MADLPSPASPAPAAPTAPVETGPKRRIALAAGLALLWTCFALLAQFSGALDTFEQPLLDWRQTLAANPAPPGNQLALIAIDKIPDDHPWPWSRLEYSLTLRCLIDYTPQSVVFEMNLNDRDTEFTSFDETFSHIVKRANTVVFASTLLTKKNQQPLPDNLGSLPFHGDGRLIPSFGSALWPLNTFAGNSPVGANNLESDPDLHLRHLPLVFFLNGKMVPSLVLQAAAQYLGADLPSSEVQPGRAIFLRRQDGTLLRTVPIDSEGRMTIRFHPGAPVSWQASFDNLYLYDEAIQRGDTPERNLRELARRQVWIGRTDAGERNQFQTPVGLLSRVEIELQAERNIIDRDYVHPLPPMILSILYLLIAIAIATAIVRFGAIHSAAILILMAAFWIESSVLAFRLYNVILPLPSFAILLFGAYAVGLLASYWDLDAEENEAPPRASAP